jgi:hypothetical protein
MQPKSKDGRPLERAERHSRELTELTVRVRNIQLAARDREQEKIARLQGLRLAKEIADRAATAASRTSKH